jgi:hypothetical protein
VGEGLGFAGWQWISGKTCGRLEKKMAFAGRSAILKSATVLEQLLEEINFQRTKEMRHLLKDGMNC